MMAKDDINDDNDGGRCLSSFLTKHGRNELGCHRLTSFYHHFGIKITNIIGYFLSPPLPLLSVLCHQKKSIFAPCVRELCKMLES